MVLILIVFLKGRTPSFQKEFVWCFRSVFFPLVYSDLSLFLLPFSVLSLLPLIMGLETCCLHMRNRSRLRSLLLSRRKEEVPHGTNPRV